MFKTCLTDSKMHAWFFKGIGFETALKIAAAGVKVILACRTEVLGQEAADKLKALGYDVEYRNLDISDSTSIERFVKSMKNDYSKLDILVNNAAIAIAEGSDIPAKEHAFRTVNCNVFGTIKLTEALLPLLRNADAPRIVNVASQLGHLKTLTSTSLRTRFANVASVSEVEALMREFIQVYEDGTYIEKGWTHTEYTAYSVYSVSKVGLLAWNAVLARDELAHDPRKNFLINAVCLPRPLLHGPQQPHGAPHSRTRCSHSSAAGPVASR